MLRNLLYNCCPVEQSGEWLRNIQKLNEYADTFNKRRLVIIRTGPGMAEPHEVRKAFTFQVEFVELPNDPVQREAAGLSAIFERLRSQRSDEITFYAHTKGVGYVPQRFTWFHPGDEWQLTPIRKWRDTMYEQCLGDPERIDRIMSLHATCGCFRQQLNLKHWAFYGTFFWLRHDRWFQAPTWQTIPSWAEGTIEAYPSSLFPIADSYCLYERDPKEAQFSLYTTPYPFKCTQCSHVQIQRIGLGHASSVPCQICDAQAIPDLISVKKLLSEV